MIFTDFGKCYEIAQVLSEKGYKVEINEITSFWGKASKWELVIND